MANFKKDVFWGVVGRRRAGSDVTQVIEDFRGRRGTKIPWVTKDRWVKSGLLRRDAQGRLFLTAKGVQSKKKAKK